MLTIYEMEAQSQKVYCSVCGFKTRRFEKLRKHFGKKHRDQVVLHCPLCEFVTLQNGEIKSHKKTFHASEKYTCLDCEFSTKRWKKWLQHKSSSHATGGDSHSSKAVESCEKYPAEATTFINQRNNSDSDKIRPIIKSDGFVGKRHNESSQGADERGHGDMTVKEELSDWCPVFKLSPDSTIKLSPSKRVSVHLKDQTRDCDILEVVNMTSKDKDERYGSRGKVVFNNCASPVIDSVEGQQSAVSASKNYEKNRRNRNNKKNVEQKSASSIVAESLHNDLAFTEELTTSGLPSKRRKKDKGNKDADIIEDRVLQVSEKSNIGTGSTLVNEVDFEENHENHNGIVTKQNGLGKGRKKTPKKLSVHHENGVPSTDSDPDLDVESLDNQKSPSTSVNGVKKSKKSPKKVKEVKGNQIVSEEGLPCEMDGRSSGKLPELAGNERDDEENRNEVNLLSDDYDTSSLDSLNENDNETDSSHLLSRIYQDNAELLGALEKHMTNQEKSKQKHICSHCNKSFKQAGSLSRHLRIHSEDKPFKCDICSFASKHQRCLTLHAKKHASQKEFVCEVCEKKFVKKINLTYHMQTHVGDRPYKCDFCQYSATLKVNLKAHLRGHHDQRIYTCKLCEYTTPYHATLKYHERIHTNVRPYPCSICSKKFKRRSHAQGHERTVHKLSVKNLFSGVLTTGDM